MSNNVTVFGVGRLGLCLALVMERAGYNVLGVDIFPKYVDSLNDKTFRSNEPRVNEFLESSKNFRATTAFEEGLEYSDFLYIMVATPSGGGEKFYDHTALSNLLERINSYKVANKHVIIGCTIMPGYIRNIASELLHDCENVTITYNPEFIAQGDIIRGLLQPDMVLIGEGDSNVGEHLEEHYKRMTENEPKICRMSAASAEICKLATNCFITMKISYANQVGDIADRTEGADKFDILRAVGSDSRVGGKCLLPGYGFGGPCFPRDNRALGLYAKSVGINPMLMIATDEYNFYHADRLAENLLKEDREEYVVEDVAYKPQCPVPIVEESQPLAVACRLVKAGKKVTIRDRRIIVDAARKEWGNIFQYEYTD